MAVALATIFVVIILSEMAGAEVALRPGRSECSMQIPKADVRSESGLRLLDTLLDRANSSGAGI